MTQEKSYKDFGLIIGGSFVFVTIECCILGVLCELSSFPVSGLVVNVHRKWPTRKLVVSTTVGIRNVRRDRIVTISESVISVV